MHHILFIEDDREIGQLVRDFLTRESYSVRWIRSGAEMAAALAMQPTDLVILDLMLPGEDGLSLCRKLRATGGMPILMLTAKSDDLDRIIGLEIGADDYMGKPFNPRELLARIRAILRRTTRSMSEASADRRRLRFANFIFDTASRRLTRDDGSEIELSSGDFELLSVFICHPQRVLSRDQLMDLTKGRSWEAFDRSIDVALSRLRRKIEIDPAHPLLLKTVRNGGYVLAAEVSEDRSC